MSVKTRLAAAAFVAASVLSGGVAAATQSGGTWAPAADWDGLSPGSFSFQCRALGGTPTFDGDLWICTNGKTTIACRQSSSVTSTSCRRYTKFVPVRSSTYYGGPSPVAR